MNKSFNSVLNFWKTQEVETISVQIKEMIYMKKKSNNIRMNKLDGTMYCKNSYAGILEMKSINVRYFEKRPETYSKYSLQNEHLKINDYHKIFKESEKLNQLDDSFQNIPEQEKNVICLYKKNNRKSNSIFCKFKALVVKYFFCMGEYEEK
ncbi:uncharacterized protein VNE69_01050 [Vairimorpha necatrix]|uniref:Uncharacterized protein n=1 Tax=Vairimorpha necatrix TaxID=6039 RepID=A0AAX4J816_9MICR